MAPWIKSATEIRGDGSKTIRYESRRTENKVESRKKMIPHANGIGFWYHTSYYVIRPDGTEKECSSLAAAKAAAEKE